MLCLWHLSSSGKPCNKLGAQHGSSHMPSMPATHTHLMWRRTPQTGGAAASASWCTARSRAHTAVLPPHPWGPGQPHAGPQAAQPPHPRWLCCLAAARLALGHPAAALLLHWLASPALAAAPPWCPAAAAPPARWLVPCWGLGTSGWRPAALPCCVCLPWPKQPPQAPAAAAGRGWVGAAPGSHARWTVPACTSRGRAPPGALGRRKWQAVAAPAPQAAACKTGGGQRAEEQGQGGWPHERGHAAGQHAHGACSLCAC